MSDSNSRTAAWAFIQATMKADMRMAGQSVPVQHIRSKANAGHAALVVEEIDAAISDGRLIHHKSADGIGMGSVSFPLQSAE